MVRRFLRVLPAALLFGGLLTAVPDVAEAKSTFFLVELQTGLGESAYVNAAPGLAYGLSAGTTFKLKVLPIRWYVLGTVTGRNTTANGRLGGSTFTADRRDLDLYVSQRFVVPVYKNFRVFAEAGIGQRHVEQTVYRSDLGTVSEGSNHLLIVLAAGMQARLTPTFSVGLRGELTPIANRAGLAGALTDLHATPNRLSLMGQLGVHF